MTFRRGDFPTPGPLLRAEVRGTLGLAAPLIGAQLLTMSMVVVDNIVVGRLGPQPLAAMALGSAIYSFCLIVCIGLLSAVGPLVSSSVGAGRDETVGRTVQRGWHLSLVLAVLMIALCDNAGPMLRALGQNPDLIALAQRFLSSAAWGVPAATGYLALRQWTEGISDTRPSMVVAAVAAGLNPFYDVGFVLGRFGLPQLGLAGAGIALSLANWTMFGLLLLYLKLNPAYRKYRFWRQSHAAGHTYGDILRLGLPLSGSLLSEMSFFGVATFVMGTLGTVALAAHQIALNVCSLAFMVPLGVSFAAAIRVSQARGRADRPAVRLAARAAAILVLGSQCLSATCFWLFAPLIVGWYTADPAVILLASELLRIGAVFQLFDGLQVVGMGVLRGVHDTRVPFLCAFSAYWLVGVPLEWYLTVIRHGGPHGLWYGMVVGLGVAALLHLLRFSRVTR